MQNVKITIDGKQIDPLSISIDIATANVDPPTSGIDLANWKLTLPTGDSKPSEILQPKLALYADKDFVRNADGSLTFVAHVDGKTTSNSGYPRSELREMKGKDLAAWSTSSGTHRMTVRQSVDHLPVKKPEVVAGQIHGKDDDLAVLLVRGKGSLAQLIARFGDSDERAIVDNYVLGTPFTLTMLATANVITITVDGLSKSKTVKDSGCYFKAGCYTQSNLSKGDTADAYGQVTIFDLKVSHA